MPRDRRDFLLLATAGTLAPTLGGAVRARAHPPTSTPGAKRFVRRDIHTLAADGPEIAALRRGVAAMMARPASDPTNWRFQANIHETDDASPPGMPATHREVWGTCRHGDRFFLSWHRMYLCFFERILRAATGAADFALAYWNYEPVAQHALPLPFREPRAGNPLFVAERNDVSDPGLPVAINAGAPVPAREVSAAARRATRFGGAVLPPGFTQLLEGQPHNILHVVIGGTGWMFDPRIAARELQNLPHQQLCTP